MDTDVESDPAHILAIQNLAENTKEDITAKVVIVAALRSERNVR